MQVIKQVIIGSGDTQTIKMIVRDSERGPQGPQGIPGGTIQYSAGIGIDISDQNVISATGVAGVAWGAITGTLNDQTDLKNALALKADKSSLATVATSGKYSDLTGKPALATVATTGAYSDLTGTPTTASLINLIYPVGSYYETSDVTFNPNVSWTGTWVEDTAGRVLVAKDTGTFNAVGATGGEETHTLTISEMPTHNHPLSVAILGSGGGVNSIYGAQFSATADGSVVINQTAPSTGEVRWGVENNGGDGSHNNLQPYIVIRRWHRTA